MAKQDVNIKVSVKDASTTALKKIQGGLGNLTTATKVSAGAMVTATGAMAVAIKAASDASETHSKFLTVFGDLSKGAAREVENLRDNYAMSRREAEYFMGAMQDLLVPMGMASGAAFDMSGKVVRLAADLGSFNNLETDQVMADIQSALVGNFETMKKYGIVLNATLVQEKALALGYAKTKEELTAADKAQAAYKIIVAGSGAAVGDMSRTMGGFANQMKVAKAKAADFAVAVGDELLPVATEWLTAANDWYVANQDLIDQKVSEYVGTLADHLESAAAKGAEFVPYLDDISGWAGELWDTFESLPTWAKEVGVVGAIMGGKKGVVVAAGLLHLANRLQNTAAGFAAVSDGQLSFWDLATSNGEELSALLDELDRKGRNNLAIHSDAADLTKVTGHTKPADMGALIDSIGPTPPPTDDPQGPTDRERKRQEELAKARYSIVTATQAVNAEILVMQGQHDDALAAQKLAALRDINEKEREANLKGITTLGEEFNAQRLAVEQKYDLILEQKATERRNKELERTASLQSEIISIKSQYGAIGMDQLAQLEAEGRRAAMALELADVENTEEQKALIREKYRQLDEKAERDLQAGKGQMVSQSLGNMGRAMGQFNKAAGGQSKELFEMQKAFSIGQAIMNTYTGATKALAQGGIFGAVLAATVVASGMAQVAAIRAQKAPAYRSGGVTGADTIYRAGERPEAIVPLPDGRSIPVSMQGQGGGAVVNIAILIDPSMIPSDTDIVQVVNRDILAGGILRRTVKTT